MNGLNPIYYIYSLYPRNKFLRYLDLFRHRPNIDIHFDEMIHLSAWGKGFDCIFILPIHSKLNVKRVKDERF